jgi:putative ABC transport system permease protein
MALRSRFDFACLIGSLVQDLRFGLRMLRKNRGFTVVAALTLALGIGANIAIFSVIEAVILRPLPFSNSSRLIDIGARSTLFDFEHLGISLPDVMDIRAGATTLAGVAPYRYSSKEFFADGQPDRIEAADISESFFPLLGVSPLFGRTFTSADMQPGSHVVILGHKLWRERFGSDPAVVGKSILLNGETQTIVGVVPDQMQAAFPEFELWTPLVPTPKERTDRGNHDFSVLALLKPRSTVERTQKELDAIAARLASDYPDVDKGWSFHATSLQSSLLGDASTPLLILFGAVGFVLLIACANVSNLFLSRGWSRRREFAIRSALGATPSALLRQQFVESLLIALLGGAAAFLIATWTIHGVRALLPADTPRLQTVGIESGVVYFTLGASLLAALLSGLGPAIVSSRQNAGAAIKAVPTGSGANASFTSPNSLLQLLVVGEVALAVILVIGATLAVRSFAKILTLDPGFRPDHLITMSIEFPEFRFSKAEQAQVFVQQVLDGTRAIPGVQAASAGIVFPLGDSVAETTFITEQSAKEAKSNQQMVRSNQVAPEFFRTLGIGLLAGRDFENGDVAGGPRVFIVNEAFARKVFGSLDVIGKRFAVAQSDGFDWGEIVGVSRSVREVDPGAESKPEVYAAFSQARSTSGIYLIVRTRPEPMVIASAIEKGIWALDKQRPVTSIKTIEKQIAENNATPRSQSTLLGIFGGLGLLLAIVGVYGVMSYIVSQQTREIGIRMALGAAPEQVLRLIVTHGLKLTLAGVAIGVGASLALTRFIRSLLFGISATDPITFAAVAISLTLMAAFACYIPARRAMRVDPMIALRHE